MIYYVTAIFALVIAISNVGCSHHIFFKSRLERARYYEKIGRYEDAIKEAETTEALKENGREALQIIARSMEAKMNSDIELAWTLPDEELRKRGIYVARDCFSGAEQNKNKSEAASSNR